MENYVAIKGGQSPYVVMVAQRACGGEKRGTLVGRKVAEMGADEKGVRNFWRGKKKGANENPPPPVNGRRL